MKTIDELNNTEIYIYDINMKLLGVIDEFISLRWNRCYFTSGDFELVVTPNSYNTPLLKENNILLRKGDTEGAIVENIEINDDGTQIEYSVSGRLLSSILSRRIVLKQCNFNGDYIDGMKAIQGSGYMNTLTSNYSLEPTTDTSSNIIFQCTYKNIYDYICKLSEASGVGYRIVCDPKNKKLIFQTYQGLDRTHNQNDNTRYLFYKENVEKVSYTGSNKACYNYVLIGGEGEGSERIMTSVGGNKTGIERWETFVDADSEKQEELPLDEYKKVLQTKGRESLKTKTEKIDFTAYSDDYKKYWDLGDVVDVQLLSLDLIGTYRITEVEEVIEDGKHTIYPTFDTPETKDFEDD